jgi:hypothetical protein
VTAEVMGSTWSANARPLVFLGAESIALEFPIGEGGLMNPDGYQNYTASIGEHRFSIRLPSSGSDLPFEERVAQAKLRVSASSDSGSPWETVELLGAAQVIDNILRLEVNSPELANLIAASPKVESRFTWSDSDGKRVTMHGTTAFLVSRSELPPVTSVDPRMPSGDRLVDPSASAECLAQLVVGESGRVSAVRVTGCELAYAESTILALREWTFPASVGRGLQAVTQTVRFYGD